jgi:hypothetical protein
MASADERPQPAHHRAPRAGYLRDRWRHRFLFVLGVDGLPGVTASLVASLDAIGQ